MTSTRCPKPLMAPQQPGSVDRDNTPRFEGIEKCRCARTSAVCPTTPDAVRDRAVDCFWPSGNHGVTGLTPRRTVERLSRLLDGDAGPDTKQRATGTAAAAPASSAAVPAALQASGSEADERASAPELPRPAICIDMDADEGRVVVRRVGDNVLLGVFMDGARDGAGMCFTPVRSPRAIKELRDEGIIV